MKLFLLAFLGTGLVFVIYRMMKGKSKAVPNSKPIDLANLSINNARVGDIVNIPGAAANYDDLEFIIDRKHRYEWGSDLWYELSGKSASGRVSVTVEDEDVSLSLPGSTHRLKDIQLSEDDLVRFDEEQSADNSATLDGQNYSYESSHEVGYFEDDGREAEGFYSWEFESDDGKSYLSIEKWEGEAFEVFHSTKIPFDTIKVFRR